MRVNYAMKSEDRCSWWYVATMPGTARLDTPGLLHHNTLYNRLNSHSEGIFCLDTPGLLHHNTLYNRLNSHSEGIFCVTVFFLEYFFPQGKI